MNQQKIGTFMKELRRGKNLTQEQFAEEIGVTGRTVSRWETGSNMPDLDILMQLADYYKVDLRELLDGERKSEKMDKELESTVLKVADYSNAQNEKLTRRMNIMFLVAVAAMVLYLVMEYADIPSSDAIDFIRGLALGISFGMLVVGAIGTSRFGHKIRDCKMRLLKRGNEGENKDATEKANEGSDK